jgi:hypothetical protein
MAAARPRWTIATTGRFDPDGVSTVESTGTNSRELT